MRIASVLFMFMAVLLIVIMFVLNYNPPKLAEKYELYPNHAEQVETQSVQIAPMGNANVSVWKFRAIVDSVKPDMVDVTAILRTEPWKLGLSIPYPKSFSGRQNLIKGDTVLVQGQLWEVAYGAEWNYTILPKP